ncbi:unnamed protein product [Euphydryas editha]|uniref:HAT C-terminal dimerisation domain-containing protein n=1 Tax=Euphydryas editha TaxID=104508 RepID=A0AAU9U026_EUPED|nr:unnamed protein product [Euphydryas editha]
MFTQRGLPLDNIIGFASDGCNVVMGPHNSLASRLHSELPGIQIFKCICHSMHLCANEACKKPTTTLCGFSKKRLSPEEAVRHSNRENFPSMLPLTQKSRRIVKTENDLQKIDDEWRLLPDVNKFSTLDIGTWRTHEFWENIQTSWMFALDVLCLPYSNADCEKIFSQVNNMKTRMRNKLVTSTVNKTLLARQLIQNQGNCTYEV